MRRTRLGMAFLFVALAMYACGEATSKNIRTPKNDSASANKNNNSDQVVVDGPSQTPSSKLDWDGKSLNGTATFDIIATE